MPHVIMDHRGSWCFGTRLAPNASRVRLIGQPERGAFMRTPKTNCNIKSVDLAYNRLHNATRTARMYRVRKGSGYG